MLNKVHTYLFNFLILYTNYNIKTVINTTIITVFTL
nr:MAG TPA: hypothetical protein [Caudoviricetes sp.]